MSGSADVPPTVPEPRPPSGRDGLETYNRVAETVGGLPTLRLKDNVIQGTVVIGCTLLGAGVGYLIGAGRGNGVLGAIAGAACAMIGSALISGLVLMVLGWVRLARRPK